MHKQQKTIAVLQGDITQIAADAIVNSAHESLRPGGGVSGAIHAQAGPVVAEQCAAIYAEHGAQRAGAAVATEAGQLDASFIIHAVGPRWQGGHAQEAGQLAQTYQNIIATAEQLKAGTISIPAISVGIFGFPLQQATAIALQSLMQALHTTTHVHTVLLVCFSPDISSVYKQELARIKVSATVHLLDLTPTI